MDEEEDNSIRNMKDVQAQLQEEQDGNENEDFAVKDHNPGDEGESTENASSQLTTEANTDSKHLATSGDGENNNSGS